MEADHPPLLAQTSGEGDIFVGRQQARFSWKGNLRKFQPGDIFCYFFTENRKLETENGIKGGP
jgi:hypothetical protein